MVGAIAILLVFQVAGEVIHRLLGVPVPGSVIGMVLLVVWLVTTRGDRTRLEAVAAWLTAHLSIMFVPAAVGIMEQGQVFARFGTGIVLATGISTLLTIVVTALVMRWALARFGGDEQIGGQQLPEETA